MEITAALLKKTATPLRSTDFSKGKVFTVGWEPDLQYAWDDGVAIGRYLKELKQGRIMAKHCRKCGRIMLPPRMFCERCWRITDEWVPVKDTGRVNTFAISHVDWAAGRLPKGRRYFTPAVIEIDGASRGMRTMKKTRVILADDHTIMREGLRGLLAQVPRVEVVAEAEDGRAAVKLARKLAPDVIIMDIGMPDLNGIEATRQIMAKSPDVKVLGLSIHCDRRFVAQMLAAGAAGYLPKDCAFEELASAISTVAANRKYLSPSVVDTVVEHYVQQMEATGSTAYTVLSPREREVLQLMAEGQTTKQIALSLHVSPKTVETHRRQAMEKLGLYSVAELTRYAVREGLVSL